MTQIQIENERDVYIIHGNLDSTLLSICLCVLPKCVIRYGYNS